MLGRKFVLKEFSLKFLKWLLKYLSLFPENQVIKIFFPFEKKPLNIPLYFREKVVYKIILSFLKRVPEGLVVEVKLPDIKWPVKIRARTSDTFAFLQIFRDRDYDISVEMDPHLIIDGGANVGYAAVFFANRFPRAKIIAIEPEKSNFLVLRENTSPYTNIEVINSAIWSKRSYLKVKDPGIGKWGMVVEEASGEKVEVFLGMTIGEILRSTGMDEIDILKLDIEGAEKEIFTENYEEWLGRVKVLIIELHEKMKPGCREVFYSAVRRYNFAERKRGENIVLIRRDIVTRFN